MAKYKNVAELVKSHPGAYNQRKELILALCQSPVIAKCSMTPKQLGDYVVDLANVILEREWNG